MKQIVVILALCTLSLATSTETSRSSIRVVASKSNSTAVFSLTTTPKPRTSTTLEVHETGITTTAQPSEKPTESAAEKIQRLAENKSMTNSTNQTHVGSGQEKPSDEGLVEQLDEIRHRIEVELAKEKLRNEKLRAPLTTKTKTKTARPKPTARKPDSEFDRCPQYDVRKNPRHRAVHGADAHHKNATQGVVRETFCCGDPVASNSMMRTRYGLYGDHCVITRYKGMCKDKEAGLRLYPYGPYCCHWKKPNLFGVRKKHMHCAFVSPEDDLMG